MERRFTKHVFMTAWRRMSLALLLLMLTTVTTWADNSVTLTSSTSTNPSWTNGNTYVTNGDVNIANRITVTGNVTLILTDGYILTASKGIEVSEGNSLTIKGGTNGTGKLIIEGCTDGKAGIGGVTYGNITINGGRVNVKGGAYGAGIGGNNYSSITGNGTITINGGIVNATGGTKAAGIGGGRGSNKAGAYGGCGAIVINGGQVTATGGGDGPGIGPGYDNDDNTSGSLALGWTNTLDFIQVTGVKSNLNGVYGFSNRLGSISFAEEDKKFKIVGGGEATTDNIKNQVSVELIPKGSEQYHLSVATISGISASYDLTGSYLDIHFSVSDAKGNTLTLGTDYTATLGTTSQESDIIHITEGGKYTLTITGMGLYAGSKSVDFEVVSIGFKEDANGDDYINMPKNGIYDANIPEGVSSFKVYDDGGAKAQYSNSYDGGLVLTAPDHYVLQLTGTVTAEVSGNTLYDYLMVYDGGSTSAQKIGDKYGSDEPGEDIGTLISSGTQMTLTFHSDNSGQRDGLDLKVTLKRDLGSCVIADIDDQPYTGSAIKPDLVITYEGTALVKDEDYEVTYSDNTIVGTATITITGKENYAGTTSKTFTIVKATPTVTPPAAVENLIYTGGSLNLVAAGTTDFGTLLYSTDGNNYSEDIPTATDAGTYTVYYKVAGDANHNDVSGYIEVTIMGKNIAACDITVPNQTLEGPNNPFDNIYHKFDYANNNYSQDYAQAFIAGMGVVIKDGDNTLTLGTDYTFGSVKMANGDPIPEKSAIGDECKVEIVGQGNYAGSKWETFKIVAPDAGGTWGDNNELTWAFHDGTLTISPTENVQTSVAMKEANAGDYPWFSSANYIETITIGEGVSTVAANAFNRVVESNVYGNVTTVNLPSTLTTIGDNAFAFCTGATITIPTSVTTLGANPFNQVRCVVISKPLEDGNDNSDLISKIRFANSTTFTYKRSFTANVASTVCLPFAHTPSSEGTYYTFMAIDKTTSPWTVTMTSNTAASLTANTPYMFMPAATGEVSFSGTASSFDPTSTYSSDVVYDPVVVEGKWNLIGTYESRQWDDTHNTGEIGSVYGFAAQNYDGGGSYTVSPGDFVKAMAGASIAPFRAYLKYTAPVSNAPRRGTAEEALPSRMSVRLVNADGDVTAIGTIDTKTGEIRFDSEAWYTLDGRRLDSKPAQKGVYINNGKKIIVK